LKQNKEFYVQEIKLTNEMNTRKRIFDKWFQATCDVVPARKALNNATEALSRFFMRAGFSKLFAQSERVSELEHAA
jgi:hypothetical protein